jgi:hypothetical protein
MNRIASIRTAEVNGPTGPTNAIMIGLDILDKSDLNYFMQEVATTFTSQMMISSPETNMMLITITGDCTATEFKQHWSILSQSDPAVGIFMNKMEIADIIHGTTDGKLLDQTSLKYL